MSKFRVLVVDDESAILGLMKALFEREGYVVATAESAAAAIEVLGHEQFDVLVTDLRMETPLAGFEVVHSAQERRPKPFTVLLTAFPVPASDWKRAGADALYMKGPDAFKLPQQIAGMLKRHSQAETASSLSQVARWS